MRKFKTRCVWRVTWSEWHERLTADSDFRATLAEIADLRRRARINKQLAAAVPADSGSYWSRDIAGQWVKRDTPAAARAKLLKRRYRADFAKQIKAARARIPFQSPEVRKARISIGRPAPVDYSAVAEQARERITRLWPDRHSADSRATIRYDLARLRLIVPRSERPERVAEPLAVAA